MAIIHNKIDPKLVITHYKSGIIDKFELPNEEILWVLSNEDVIFYNYVPSPPASNFFVLFNFLILQRSRFYSVEKHNLHWE
jgi:hypothetical protein